MNPQVKTSMAEYFTMSISRDETVLPLQDGLVTQFDELVLEAMKFLRGNPIDFVLFITRKSSTEVAVTSEHSLAGYMDAIRYEEYATYIDPSKIGITHEIHVPKEPVIISMYIKPRKADYNGEAQITLYARLKKGSRRPKPDK